MSWQEWKRIRTLFFLDHGIAETFYACKEKQRDYLEKSCDSKLFVLSAGLHFHTGTKINQKKSECSEYFGPASGSLFQRKKLKERKKDVFEK